MEAPRSGTKVSRRNERGFTLPEVLITIVIMGIIFAIATTSWNSVTDSRRVDSATNQLVADLRLAHSSATNQLKGWLVTLPSSNGSSTYTIGPAGAASSRSLPNGTQVNTADTITFNSDGSAADPTNDPTKPISINVASTWHSHVICIYPTTSEVKVRSAGASSC